MIMIPGYVYGFCVFDKTLHLTEFIFVDKLNDIQPDLQYSVSEISFVSNLPFLFPTVVILDLVRTLQ